MWSYMHTWATDTASMVCALAVPTNIISTRLVSNVWAFMVMGRGREGRTSVCVWGQMLSVRAADQGRQRRVWWRLWVMTVGW